jgi:hypothetical protein
MAVKMQENEPLNHFTTFETVLKAITISLTMQNKRGLGSTRKAKIILTLPTMDLGNTLIKPECLTKAQIATSVEILYYRDIVFVATFRFLSD